MTIKQHAGQLMEDFFEIGAYKELKVAEKRTQEFRSTLRSRLYEEEGNRHVFEQQGVVSKFIKKGIYKIDQLGMNEYLNDIGIFPLVAEIDQKKVKGNELLDLFLIPSDQILGISTNKQGRYTIEDSFIEESMDIESLMNRYIHFDRSYEQCITDYEQVKNEIMQCPLLKEEGKFQHKYGSVYLKNNPHKRFNVNEMIKEFGIEFLLEIAKPNGEKIDQFIQQGTLKRADLDQFKELVDYRVDFVIMSLENEERMLSFLHDKRMIAARNSA